MRRRRRRRSSFLSFMFWLFVLYLVFAAADSHAQVPMPAGAFSVIRAQCPDNDHALGCAYEDEIYVRPGAGPFIYWHEVGHLYDWTVLTDSGRDQFMQLTRRWNTRSRQGWDRAMEVFADAYAVCVMQESGRRQFGVTYWDGHQLPQVGPVGSYGYFVPTWSRHRRVCQLIWNAGGVTYPARRHPWTD